MNSFGKSTRFRSSVLVGLAIGGSCSLTGFSADLPVPVDPASMPAIGQVDKRFQSFNVEMLEVTGGRFWKSYKDIAASSAQKTDADRPGSNPTGMSASLYGYRPPTDLSNARLRKLAAALGPSYMRVSGTWANTTYFHNHEGPGPAPVTPPKGFNGVLTRERWKGVVDFSHAVNAEIITSFATSEGTRNAAAAS